jgi:hypothetical protein
VKTLSVIIPVYNEEETIAELLDRVAAAEVEVMKEIVVVNDGSRDSSPAIIAEWRDAHPDSERMRVVAIDKVNGGKGSAVRTGIERSTGDVVIIQDADLEYDPNDYQRCIAPILAGTCKVVYGSRERLSDNRLHSSIAFYAGGLAVTYWMNLLFGASMTDEPTCYKTFDGELIRTLSFRGDKFDWEPEITAKLLRLGYHIHEVPVSYFPRQIEEGKKITWRDGVDALLIALLWRVRPLGGERAKLATLPSEAPRLATARRSSRLLWSIVAVAFIARLLLALPGLLDDPRGRFYRPDSSSYVNPALALVADGELNVAPGSDEPMTLRPPGFAVFLATVFAVTGEGLVIPVLLLCLVSALVCIPIYAAARLYGGVNAAGIAPVPPSRAADRPVGRSGVRGGRDTDPTSRPGVDYSMPLPGAHLQPQVLGKTGAGRSRVHCHLRPAGLPVDGAKPAARRWLRARLEHR